ncbi:tannase/feruloyl esterase family alpha/beta hydrolase [Actinomadura physcomitrii]|nr:tannase/feruloyl esterase family alpha/beta hydrolase [Actinomadura physcomitrii]
MAAIAEQARPVARWADRAISPYGTLAYRHALTERMGGQAATERFARLLVLPGVNHCGGGQAPDTIDALTSIVDWVERGTTPDRLVAMKTESGKTVRSRPVFRTRWSLGTTARAAPTTPPTSFRRTR